MPVSVKKRRVYEKRLKRMAALEDLAQRRPLTDGELHSLLALTAWRLWKEPQWGLDLNPQLSIAARLINSRRVRA